MKNSAQSTLDKERHIVNTGLWALLCASASGVITHLVPGNAVWQQMSYLFHLFCGLVISVFLLPYCYQHFKRTIGIRKPLVVLFGGLSAIVFLGLTLSGIYVSVFGQTEVTRVLFDWHIYLAYITLILISFHIVAYVFSKHRNEDNKFQSFAVSSIKATLQRMVAAATILLTFTVLYTGFSSSQNTESVPSNYQKPYGDNPFAPAQTQTENMEFLRTSDIANSNTCGTCHQQIFDEWKSSIHSQAASDIAYMKNIDLLVETKGIAAARYCEGCHAPVALLTGELTEGGNHGGVRSTPANHEGVGCLICHNANQVVHVKGNGSYNLQPNNDYLFANTNNVIARSLHNFLINIQPESHRNQMSQPVLSSPRLCATCHVQFMDDNINDFGWVKMQDEYSAWLQSSYSGQTHQEFSKQDTLGCQDCHMPGTDSTDPSADYLGQAKSHRFLGSNTAIPALNNDTVQLAMTRQFLQSDKIRIHVEKPWRDDAIQSSIPISESIRARTEKPYYLYLGETANIQVTVTNNGVGHDFPGGSIDINQAWLGFRVVDATNAQVYQSGFLNEDATVDPDAIFYHAIAIDKNGNHVWKHDLFRMVGESYKNVIPAGHTDTVQYSFKVPTWAKTPLTITSTLRYRKFNNRYARWATGDHYQELPIVDMAQDSLKIAILKKAPAK